MYIQFVCNLQIKVINCCYLQTSCLGNTPSFVETCLIRSFALTWQCCPTHKKSSFS